MEEHSEAVEQPKKSYEEPTLVEREDLLQITESPVLAGVSEGVGAV